MAQTGGGIRFTFKGLRALDRALGKADKNLRTALRGDLKTVAGQVARKAQDIAEQKGLRETGDLIAGIRPYALTGRAGVKSTAVHRGYPYPLRLEYGRRMGYRYGPDASLNPAVEASRSEIERGLEVVLDHLADDYQKG